MRAAPGEPGGGGIPMMPVCCRQADWLPCPGILLDKLRGVVSNRSTNKKQRRWVRCQIMQPFFRDDCMDVGWNEARMDERVKDGYSQIREVKIEYSRRIDGNNGAASISAFQRSLYIFKKKFGYQEAFFTSKSRGIFFGRHFKGKDCRRIHGRLIKFL